MNVSSAAISAQKLEKQQELDELRARLAETEEDMAQLEEIESQLTAHSVIVNVPDINVPPAQVTVSVPDINVPAADVNVNIPDITVPPAEVSVNVPQPEVNVTVPTPEVVVNVPTQPQPTAMTLQISDDTINRLVTALAGIQQNTVSFTASDDLKDVLRQIITHENIQVPGLLDTVNSLE